MHTYGLQTRNTRNKQEPEANLYGLAKYGTYRCLDKLNILYNETYKNDSIYAQLFRDSIYAVNFNLNIIVLLQSLISFVKLFHSIIPM